MKILFIARNIPIPGINENPVILNIAEKLVKQGHQVDIIYPVEWIPFKLSRFSKTLRSREATLGGINFKNFKIIGMKYLRLPFKVLEYNMVSSAIVLNKKEIQSLDEYDIIHSHFALPDGAIGNDLVKTLGNIPHIVSIRQGDLDKIDGLKAKNNTPTKYLKTLDKADQLLVLNKSMKEHLKSLGFDSDIIPHGIDYREFSREKKDSENFEIFTASRFIKRKKIDWVIKFLQDYNGSRSITYRLAGNGPELDVLKLMANQINNSNIKVEFLGKVEKKEIEKFYLESDLFVLPSEKETFGIVYLEAAMYGCPILTRKNTGVFGVFDEKEVCFFNETYMDFEKKMNTLIEDKNYRTELASLAKIKIINELTWDRVIQKYTELYKRLEK